MPDKKTLAKIHIAKKDLNINDENYRSILSGFGVDSAADLSVGQAEELIGTFKKLGWKPKSSSSSSSGSGLRNKYEELAGRSEDYPTPKQLRMIEAIWMDKSQQKTVESLNRFIKRITGKDDITWIMRSDIQRMRKAILSLKQKESVQ